MSKNYDDMTFEELTALKELKLKNKLIAEFKAEDEAEKVKEMEAIKADAVKDYLKEHPPVKDEGKTGDETANEPVDKLAQIKADAVEEYLKQNPPKEKLIEPVSDTKEGGNETVELFNSYMKDSGFSYTAYEDMKEQKWKSFEYTDSDADCPADPSSWSPADTFAKMVWHSMYCTAGLRDICVKGLNVNSGDGLSVQIRTIGKFAEPASATACGCLSCTSPAFDTYTITVGAYGMLTEICELDVFDVGEVYRSSMVKALGLRWAEFFDAQIYAALAAATPGTSEVLPTALSCGNTLEGSCCTNPDAFNMYHAIIDLDAAMREGTTPYRPDYCIVSPTVAAVLKGKDHVDIPYIMRSQITVKDGILTKIGHLKVIEYCGALSCTDETGEEVAILIDSRRAVGMAFGKPPKAEFDRNIDCDSTTVASWAYVGFSALDLNAIGHVENP